MGNLTKSELYKLFKDRSFWTLTLLLAGLAIAWPIFQYFDNGPKSTTGIELYLGSLGGNNYIVKLVPCILAGFFISSEYTTGVMKSIAATGNSRSRIYLSKFIAYSIGAMIISLIYPFFATGMGTVLFGFGDLPNVQDFNYIGRTIGLYILYSVAFASIMALAAIIFTDSGKTIGFLLMFFTVFDSMLYVLSGKFAIFKPVFNYSVFKLFIDISKMSLVNSELFKIVMVPIFTIISFMLLGMMVYRKKEIK